MGRPRFGISAFKGGGDGGRLKAICELGNTGASDTGGGGGGLKAGWELKEPDIDWELFELPIIWTL